MKQSAILLIMTMALFSCETRKAADTVYYHATIYTVDSLMTHVEAMAVKDGKIIATGSGDEIRSHYSAKNWIDLQGKYVYPGFFDAHCHFYGYGLGLQNADLTGTTSMDEIIARLKKHQQQHHSEWLIGRGWDQNEWKNKSFPEKEVLDKAFPGIPVVLERIDGHAYFVSSKVLQMAGIHPATSVNGGRVVHNAKGEPSGVLVDNAMSLVYSILPKSDSVSDARALLDAQKNCLAVGLTCVADAGLDAQVIGLMDALQHEQKLKMRIYAMVNPNKENFEKYVYKGPFNNGRLVICAIKIYADGALGSRGALLSKPYSDDPGNSGLMVNTPAFYNEICSLALKYGFQVNTHCIGDSANRMMLHIYSGYLKGKNDRRWRIEHAQVVDPADLHLFGDYSVIPSIQTTHATSDMSWAEHRLGPERVKWAYAYRSLLEQNGWLPNGSDFPVEKINPLLGFYAAVARKDIAGNPPNGFQVENALTREQALRAMTIWAAKACFMEKETGSLEPGKQADFVVTDQDLMSVEEHLLPRTRVLKTVIAGETVFGF